MLSHKMIEIMNFNRNSKFFGSSFPTFLPH